MNSKIEGYRKVYTSETDYVWLECGINGSSRLVDYNQEDFIEWRGLGNMPDIVPYVAPVDTRTDEEKRLAEYQTELDPILSKIQFYEMEYALEDDNTRKQEIKKDILDVLKADWKAKKKAIRGKYPTGLWKPVAGGAE